MFRVSGNEHPGSDKPGKTQEIETKYEQKPCNIMY